MLQIITAPQAVTKFIRHPISPTLSMLVSPTPQPRPHPPLTFPPLQYQGNIRKEERNRPQWQILAVVMAAIANILICRYQMAKGMLSVRKISL
mmetsp:Transcript_35632/g.49888  ORF Transcript_35632/g.49888 Transcript_35632/m.49888 type:complete len:93 (+) Transcript_35632:807-1085(+)